MINLDYGCIIKAIVASLIMGTSLISINILALAGLIKRNRVIAEKSNFGKGKRHQMMFMLLQKVQFLLFHVILLGIRCF
jgi:hypothetical protein